MNIPLNGARAPELLEIALENKIPVMVASQGGPREHLPRFRAVGTKWLHVVASVEHARKAEAAGVDALVVDGAEAGGHPPPSNVSLPFGAVGDPTAKAAARSGRFGPPAPVTIRGVLYPP